MLWQTSRFEIDLSKPKVMGIVNLTPDSFSDGGRLGSIDLALKHARSLLEEGADILDVGAESTRPGAVPIDADNEWARLAPVLKELMSWNVPISVDTYKPEIMRAALDLGADIVNDVWALRWRQPGDTCSGLDVVAQHGRCGVCVMHMHGDPQTMQVSPMQGDVVDQVKSFLFSRAAALQALNVKLERVMVDCGTGFGKTVEQNFELLRCTRDWAGNMPVLAGWSRKSSVGAVTGQPVNARVTGSVVAAVLAVQAGASVVRVHDVQATKDGLAVWQASRGEGA